MTMIIVWSLVIIAAIIVEANTADLVSMWFIPAGLVALVLAIFELPLIWQIVAFALISAVCIILSRTAFKNLLKKGEKVLDATERIIGMDALVTAEIGGADSYGEVKVDGKIWRAFMADKSCAQKGEILKVSRIEGTKIFCERK